MILRKGRFRADVQRRAPVVVASARLCEHQYVVHGYLLIAICKKLTGYPLVDFHLSYSTVTPLFSICPVHSYLDRRARLLFKMWRRATCSQEAFCRTLRWPPYDVP